MAAAAAKVGAEGCCRPGPSKVRASRPGERHTAERVRVRGLGLEQARRAAEVRRRRGAEALMEGRERGEEGGATWAVGCWLQGMGPM